MPRLSELLISGAEPAPIEENKGILSGQPPALEQAPRTSAAAPPVRASVRRCCVRKTLDLLFDEQLLALECRYLQMVDPGPPFLLSDPLLERFMLLAELIEVGRDAHERPPAASIVRSLDHHSRACGRGMIHSWIWCRSSRRQGHLDELRPVGDTDRRDLVVEVVAGRVQRRGVAVADEDEGTRPRLGHEREVLAAHGRRTLPINAFRADQRVQNATCE